MKLRVVVWVVQDEKWLIEHFSNRFSDQPYLLYTYLLSCRGRRNFPLWEPRWVIACLPVMAGVSNCVNTSFPSSSKWHIISTGSRFTFDSGKTGDWHLELWYKLKKPWNFGLVSLLGSTITQFGVPRAQFTANQTASCSLLCLCV